MHSMFRSLICSLIFLFRLGDAFLALVDSFYQLPVVPSSAVTLSSKAVNEIFFFLL